jgi:threonine/homoserine/homoserine lactone efflux protein
MLMLAGIHVAMGLLWFAILIGATLPLRRILTLRAVVRTMDRVTGTVFVALATKLAISR